MELISNSPNSNPGPFLVYHSCQQRDSPWKQTWGYSGVFPSNQSIVIEYSIWRSTLLARKVHHEKWIKHYTSSGGITIKVNPTQHLVPISHTHTYMAHVCEYTHIKDTEKWNIWRKDYGVVMSLWVWIRKGWRKSRLTKIMMLPGCEDVGYLYWKVIDQQE